MEQTQHSSITCFDISVIACDGIAYAKGETGIHQADFESIIPFIRDEMISVCSFVKRCLLEIRDYDNTVIAPYALEGRELVLSPHFFGRGYQLYVDGEPHLELTTAIWREYIGIIGQTVN